MCIRDRIWEIQKRDEESLDLYEGYPNFYDKQMMEVEVDGAMVSAMVYVMTPGHRFGIPSDHYANVIWEGYETAGFDTQVLEDAIEHAFETVCLLYTSKDGWKGASLYGATICRKCVLWQADRQYLGKSQLSDRRDCLSLIHI